MSGKCEECEFCFPHEEFGAVCADANYGEDISGSLEEIKDCYSEGFDAYTESLEEEKIPFIPGTKLKQLKIDGRKQIELHDQEGKIICIKKSKANKMMGELEINQMMSEYAYVVKAIFNSESFGTGKYLIIK